MKKITYYLLLILFLASCQSQIKQPPSDIPISKEKTPEVKTENYYISSPVTDIRKSPLENAERVTQALHGEPVKIIKKQGEWVEINLPEQFNYPGWVKISDLQKFVNTNYLEKPTIVQVASTTVYTEENIKSSVIGSLTLGTVVQSENNINKEFINVKLANGKKGYIASKDLVDYVQKNVNQVSGKDIIKTAETLVGVQYLWGGMTTYGVDCSGFIHTVFKVNGIKLHRDADLQYANDGEKIDPKDLKPGDLVFFSTYKPGPSHEGIYIGNRKFIHASSSQGVGYNSLDDEYYVKRFVGAKKVLKQ